MEDSATNHESRAVEQGAVVPKQSFPVVTGTAAVAAAPAPAVVSAVTPEPRGNFFTWPFHQENWMGSLWIPLLWWVNPVLPIGHLLGIGWSVDAVRRWSRRYPKLLPRAVNAAVMLKEGTILWLMTFVYFWIPLLILSSLLTLDLQDMLWDFVSWVWDSIVSSHPQSFESFLLPWVAKFLAQQIVPIFYVILASPIFAAASIRYALSGRINSFFNLFGNLGLVFRLPGSFFVYMLLSITVNLLFGTLAVSLAPTGVGLILVIALGAATVWIQTYLLGILGRKLCDGGKISAF